MKAEYFESGEASDLGRKRKNNEDSFLRLPENGVYCVADGMGGVAGGDLASEAIRTSLQEVFANAAPAEQENLAGRVGLFTRGINQASKWIKNFADDKVIGQMGSTVVALVFDPTNPARALGLHAGDSRLYRYREGNLEQLTEDHTAIAALVAKLGCAPASLPAKFQNELVRAVGLGETVELEQTLVMVRSGDMFVLCSDGLSRMMPDEEISKLLRQRDQESAGVIAKALVDAANEAGGKDNVTVILVKIGDISALTKAAAQENEEDPEPAGATVVAPVAEAVPTAQVARKETETYDTPSTRTGHTPPTEDQTPTTRLERIP